MLYHIVSQSDWDLARSSEHYVPDRYSVEGFIHLSQMAQVLRPANLLYRGRTDLLLLEIDETRLTAEVIYEPGSHGEDELFPHLYGPLNMGAVGRSIPFPCAEDGGFELPNELAG